MCLCVSLCEKEEVEVLRQVVAQLNDEQTALARGLTSGVFDRTDSIRQRARHRQVTRAILNWLITRQNFERSPSFVRTAIQSEVRGAGQDVDLIVNQNNVADALAAAHEALQEQTAQQEETNLPAGGGALVHLRSCAAAAAAAASDPRQPGATCQHVSTSATPPQRRRAFCLVGAGRERPAKKARPRTKQGTPYPRASAVQTCVDSADELIRSEANEVAEVVKGIPLSEKEAKALERELLLSPPAGRVDFGPRGSSDSSCDSASDSDLDLDC